MSTAERIPIRDPARQTRASFAQERMWFLDAVDPESAMYNQLIMFRIRGTIDPALVDRSFETIFRRHEVLRTNLRVKDGLIYQDIASMGPVHLKYVDLSGSPRDIALADAEKLLDADARKPFDLRSEPLVRPRLFLLGQEDYLLAIVSHHSIMDGWSIGVFIRELTTLYGNLAEGRDSVHELPPLDIQYADYSAWQREKFDRGDYDEQLRYWLKKLDGELPVLALPLDHPRPPRQSYRGKAVTVILPRELTAAIKAFCRKEKVTLFMALLTTFNVLLYRHSLQEELIVGFPVAGRNHYQKEGLIGLCVNTLPIRSFLSPEMSFLDLLRQVRSSTLEAYDNQDLPYEKLVERLPVQRSMETTPVFQAMFQLRNFPRWNATVAGHPVERYESDDVMAKFDMMLDVTETGDKLLCRFEYPVALFDQGTIVRLSRHWQTLLEDIVADPGKPVSRLRVMPDDELGAVLAMGKGIAKAYPGDSTVDRQFEARAREHPDVVAVRHNEKTVTYTQLDACAGCLADRLRARGVRPGEPVAVFIDRSAELLAGLIAVLKAGGIYLPIDTADADSRIAGILEDARVQVIITGTAMAGRASKFSQKVIVVEEAMWTSGGTAAMGLTGPESIAYIIYTSGSTGKPKGVCVPHRAILRLVLNNDHVQVKTGDTVGFTASPAFDVSTFEIWGALLNGATLEIFDKEVLVSPARLKERLDESRPDALFLATPLFHVIATECPAAFQNVGDLMVGGDVLKTGPVASIMKNGPPARVINTYGPTEITTMCTWHHVKDVPGPGEKIPLGRPIANDYLYIMDEQLQPVPIGVTGELCLGGDGLATGYLHRPELTARAFVPDPYNAGRAIYRSGDLGRFLPDGNIEFEGRVDGQLKIHGFRVEIGEVAAMLETHPAVRKAIVRKCAGPGGFNALAAYLLKADCPAVPVGEIRKYLASRLPDYMIPASLMWIEAIPFLPNSKIDHRKLPEPVFDENSGTGQHLTSSEEISADMAAMADLWKEVLGTEAVGPDDSFFSLGGHSLLAIRLLGRIEEQFKMSLPMSIIMRAPTIRQILGAMKELGQPAAESSLIILNDGGSRPPIYCFPLVWGRLDSYYSFVCQMIDRQPACGLLSPGLADPAKIPDSLEALVAGYVREIRRHQPEGPYHLFGFCSAGPVAFEAARQLEQAGEKVGFLGIVDSQVPEPEEARGRARHYVRLARIKTAFAAKVAGQFRQARAGEKLNMLARLPGFVARQALPGPRKGALPSYPGWVTDAPEAERGVIAKNYDVLGRYRFGLYGGKVTLFSSSATVRYSRIAGGDAATMGWGRLARGGVKHYVLKGDHDSFRNEENARIVADVIAESIDEAHGRGV